MAVGFAGYQFSHGMLVVMMIPLNVFCACPYLMLSGGGKESHSSLSVSIGEVIGLNSSIIRTSS